MSTAVFAGLVNAVEFAYGSPGGPPAFRMTNSVPAAVAAAHLDQAYITLKDGTKIGNIVTTTTPVLVGTGADAEEVTPSGASGNWQQYGAFTFSATFTKAHGLGTPVKSATFGLQEALNWTGIMGGGVVIVDADWAAIGGTSGMISAATSPSGVTIQDNRQGGGIGAVDSVFARTGAVVAAAGDYTAAQITNVPAGGVEAEDVQAAIDELDTEKANVADLGTAAAADLGTDPGEVPTNADLGTAAYVDTGTDAGDVPLNSDLGTASTLNAPADVPQWVAPPATASSTGTAGQLAMESGFLYVCIAADTWERVAIATW